MNNNDINNADLYGIWKHEVVCDGSAVVVFQTLRCDNTYETQMTYSFDNGCVQRIHHVGVFKIEAQHLALDFKSGSTDIQNCSDPSQNVEVREFTEAETKEAQRLLSQKIPFCVEGDSLITTVKGPMGEMKVEYNRQSSLSSSG